MFFKGKEIVFNNKKRVIASFILMLVFFCYIPKIKIPFFVNRTESLPQGFYIKLFKKAKYNKNEYVTFKPDKYVLDYNKQTPETTYMKKIVGVEGDKIKYNKKTQTLTINDKEKVLHVFILKDLNEKQNDFEYIVPKNKYFVAGTHKYSFDSRYFGVIDISQIENQDAPLIMFSDLKKIFNFLNIKIIFSNELIN